MIRLVLLVLFLFQSTFGADFDTLSRWFGSQEGNGREAQWCSWVFRPPVSQIEVQNPGNSLVVRGWFNSVNMGYNFTIDENSNPKSIDIFVSTLVLRGIYEVSGDQLQIRVNEDENLPRPQNFSSPCTNCSLFTLTRQDDNIDPALIGSWLSSVEPVDLYSFDSGSRGSFPQNDAFVFTRTSAPNSEGFYDLTLVLDRSGEISLFGSFQLGLYKIEGNFLTLVRNPPSFSTVLPRPNNETCDNCTVDVVEKFESLVNQDLVGNWIGSISNTTIFADFSLDNNRTDSMFLRFAVFHPINFRTVTFEWLDNQQSVLLVASSGLFVGNYSVEEKKLNVSTNYALDPSCPDCSWELEKLDDVADTNLEGAWRNREKRLNIIFNGNTGIRSVGSSADFSFLYFTEAAKSTMFSYTLSSLEYRFSQYRRINETHLLLVENEEGLFERPQNENCPTCISYVLEKCRDFKDCDSLASFLTPNTLILAFVLSVLSFLNFQCGNHWIQ